MILNMTITGTSSTKSIMIISVDGGSTVAIYSDAACTTKVKDAVEKNEGEFWVMDLNNGEYYIKATKESKETITSYTITEYGVYRVSMIYRTVPEFTYTGTYEIVDDNDQDISGALDTADWKIRFLTSGTLSFSKLYGASNGIDTFLVGGGGGGSSFGGAGGGGYTATHSNINVALNTEYTIRIGAGGAVSGNTAGTGGSSSFDSYTVNGGKGGEGGSGKGKGGAGGSGGAAWNNANGGSNGLNGASTGSFSGGKGQGTTTYEFGINTSNLYSSGGGTGTGTNGAGLRANNSGAGGHGSNSNSTEAGFSGIVIIRNARSVA